MVWCRQRRAAAEWIDVADTPDAAISATLRDQAWVNRRLGGADALMTHAIPVLKECPSAPVRVLDLACGGADLSRRLVEEARRLDRPIEVLALDRSAPVVTYAQKASRGYPEITVVQADALTPPSAEDAFDLVMLTTFLHHLEPAEAIAALRVARSVSRGAVVAVDLVRSPAALAAFSVLAPLAGLHPVSRHDGAASVRRSYTPAELADIARRAGFERFELHRHKFYRMALVYRQGATKDD